MKIYTKTGDEGETGLFGGGRVSKASPRVWAYGEVDELNSVLGLARTTPIDERVDATLARVQSELFDVGAELACTPGRAQKGFVPEIDEACVTRLEQAIDTAEEELAPLQNFVLPGGTLAAAHFHLARTVCRRAERRVVALESEDAPRPIVVRYLNRLSDLLFVLARLANHRAGVPDVPWSKRGA
ncbi:MAG: cob(I)yrinic acid a,c-diamide adenosyltransferase [Myxococcota bacterium]|nr:cob(I)yrinic acid a,c-diamide adenosyltransferase [Myxococcota bacterium]